MIRTTQAFLSAMAAVFGLSIASGLPPAEAQAPTAAPDAKSTSKVTIPIDGMA